MSSLLLASCLFLGLLAVGIIAVLAEVWCCLGTRSTNSQLRDPSWPTGQGTRNDPWD